MANRWVFPGIAAEICQLWQNGFTFAIGHILSVGKKMLFFDRLKNSIPHRPLFCVCHPGKKRFIEERQVPEERVVFTPFMVDADFFPGTGWWAMDKQPAGPAGVLVICAVGLSSGPSHLDGSGGRAQRAVGLPQAALV
ncbi:MAG: hypothetical protein IPJ90_08275 [Anaerolineaceae bacterium]|nr:hypothetical protein [Anaerolineaceae bacterium]